MARRQVPLHIEALLSPSTYPHPARRVELVQTHISYVLLAGDYVYKVKKPVDLGFLDYSTLEKRRFYCEEEVRLNRRLCPEAYLGVVPITSKGESVALAGTGEVVEYAVKMKRLSQERMMEALLEKDTVTSDMLTALTGKLAAFHRSSKRSEHISTFGSREKVKRSAAIGRRTLTRRTRGKLENRVYVLPRRLDNMVAKLKLRAIGAGLDRLTPEQKRYLASWQEGT